MHVIQNIAVYVAFIIALTPMSYCDSSLSKKTNSTFDSLKTSNRHQYTHRVKWLCFNTSEEYDCCQRREISCLESGPALPFSYCATYSESISAKSLSFTNCPYLPWQSNMTTPEKLPLPVSLTELNDYMCGPLNRKGLVCSECADGFGPSVTSYGYKCAKCTNAWYQVPLYLLSQLLQVTVLYILILVFRIRATWPPIPCLIIYTQMIILGFDLLTHNNNKYFFTSDLTGLLFADDGDIRLDMKIILTFYEAFNQLNVFRYVLPPLCLSSKLKQIHVVFLGYISVFYPIFLIFLTWVCVRLHDYNFRPFVWLWRPFHKCFVRLRREWDIKSDLVDVFITFFLLSYTKSSYQAFILLSSNGIVTLDQSGVVTRLGRSSADLTIDYLGHTHLPFAVFAILLLIVYNILLPLLLTLYPIRAFRSCLSKCRLDFIAVNIFADKIHSCYRNGLDGGRDMRSLSGMYLLNSIAVCLISGIFTNSIVHGSITYSFGVSALLMCLTTAMTKPYKQTYMNNMDTFILSCLALQYFAMASRYYRLARIFLFTPAVAFFLLVSFKLVKKCPFNIKTLIMKCCSFIKILIMKYCSFGHLIRRFLSATEHTVAHMDNSEASYSVTDTQPLIQPTSSDVSYGIISDVCTHTSSTK